MNHAIRTQRHRRYNSLYLSSLGGGSNIVPDLASKAHNVINIGVTIMDVFTKHQLVIAKATLRMSPIGAQIMGGMNHAQARAFLKSQGWSSERIKRFEDKE